MLAKTKIRSNLGFASIADEYVSVAGIDTDQMPCLNPIRPPNISTSASADGPFLRGGAGFSPHAAPQGGERADGPDHPPPHRENPPLTPTRQPAPLLDKARR